MAASYNCNEKAQHNYWQNQAAVIGLTDEGKTRT